MNDDNRITRRRGLKAAAGVTALGGIGTIAYASTGSNDDPDGAANGSTADDGSGGGGGSGGDDGNKRHDYEDLVVSYECVKRRGQIAVGNPNDTPVTLTVSGPDDYEASREVAPTETVLFDRLVDGTYTLETDHEKIHVTQKSVQIACLEKEPTDLEVSYRCVDERGQITITNPNRFPADVLLSGPDDFELELAFEPGETKYIGDLADGTYSIEVDDNEIGPALETIQIECPPREWTLLGQSEQNPEANVDTESVMRLYAAYTKRYYYYRLELEDPWADPDEEQANFGIGFDFEPETDFYQFQLNWSAERGFFHHVDATDRQDGLPEGITATRKETDDGAIFTFTVDRENEEWGFPGDNETYKFVANASYGGATHANISTDPAESWGGYDNDTFEWDRNQWFIETSVEIAKHREKKKREYEKNAD